MLTLTNVIGEGGFDDDGQPAMNCLQMLHGAYNIQNWQEDQELKGRANNDQMVVGRSLCL